MKQNTREVTIEWGDCDPAGIVFYPRYFEMFNVSTGQLFEAALGCKEIEFFRKFEIIGYPMVETKANFKKPSAYGDVVSITTEVISFGRSSFEIRHQLFKGSELAIEGYEKRVWAAVDPNDAKKIISKQIDSEVINALS